MAGLRRLLDGNVKTSLDGGFTQFVGEADGLLPPVPIIRANTEARIQPVDPVREEGSGPSA